MGFVFHLADLEIVGVSHSLNKVAVAHEQVSALDKLDAHLLGEEHVFEIGAVVAAGGEQNDHWVVRA